MTDDLAVLLEMFKERPPMPWVEQAACRGMGPDLFYPEKGCSHNKITLAKQVCGGCPVQRECRAYADENERFGIWGGGTTTDFEQARREQNRPLAA